MTGILPILLENARKIVNLLLTSSKEYICIMRLHKKVDEDKLMEVIKEFRGQIYQIPPRKSAIKRRLRVRTIYQLNVLEIDMPFVLMHIECEAGVYIRKLCYDIGEALGCGANMYKLRRIRSGVFREDETMVTLHDVRDAYEIYKETGDESMLRKVIQPMEYALQEFHKVFIKDSAVSAICHGAQLATPGIVKVSKGIKQGDPVVIYTLKGEAVAIGEALMSSEDMIKKRRAVCVKTIRVLMDKDLYPKMWKKSL